MCPSKPKAPPAPAPPPPAPPPPAKTAMGFANPGRANLGRPSADAARKSYESLRVDLGGVQPINQNPTLAVQPAANIRYPGLVVPVSKQAAATKPTNAFRAIGLNFQNTGTAGKLIDEVGERIGR